MIGVTRLTHMKNCEPLVSFPRLAMDNRKALSCFSVKFSSVRGRERGVGVSECVHSYVTAEIIREEQEDKRKKYFLYILISPTSPSINALSLHFKNLC